MAPRSLNPAVSSAIFRITRHAVEEVTELMPNLQIPKWSPRLSVGNAKLDEQHITLLELGRHLLNLVETAPYPKDQVRRALQDIIGLSRKHDALEERVLEDNACPTLSEHKLVHEASRVVLTDLLSDASHHILNAAVLAHAITDWMSHHISENDLPVREYLKMPPKAKAAGQQ
jgi:hemerythrin-like metal-binding protein